jgi:hypothetical protein
MDQLAQRPDVAVDPEAVEVPFYPPGERGVLLLERVVPDGVGSVRREP